MLRGVVCVVVDVLVVVYYSCGVDWFGCVYVVVCLCCMITCVCLFMCCVLVCVVVPLLRVAYLLYRVCYVCMC